jgi:DUF1680 family protein
MKSFQHMTRRQWLSTAGLAGAALASHRLFGAVAPRTFSFAAAPAAAAVQDKVAPRLQPFPMTQVRLRPGIFQQQQEYNRAYLHLLPNDRLAHMFRVTAGLPSSAHPFGGWEAPDVELRGHFTGGHYLSACALMYSSTGDEDLKTKANQLVADLAKCQQANGGGYLSAFPTGLFDRLREGKRVWAPFYTIHKIMAGHLDLYEHCGNEQALDTVQKMAGWVGNWAKPISDEQFARIQMVEFGGMNEVLYNLYAATGKTEYLELGHRFDHKKFFDPLAQGEDELKGLHANTNIPKVIGAAREYELTGEQRYRNIAQYFWREITTQRAYATGGTSNDEHWRTEPGKLASELGTAAEECCCGYNMLKLTRHIFSWNADPAAMDYYERTLFNSRLGTQDPAGLKMYYVSLAPGYWRTFGTQYDSFWCCTGTGAEEFSKFNDSIYFHDNDSVYVNLFIASELNWPEKGVRLRQDTNFPEQQGTRLTVQAIRPVDMALNLRVPYWAMKGVSLKVNGKPEHVTATPGRYLRLQRRWRNGDQVDYEVPMSLHVAPTPDDPSLQAVMYGPLVLAGQLGNDNLPKDLVYGPLAPDGTPAALPPVTATSRDPAGWVEPVANQQLAFRTTGQCEAVSLVPFYKIADQKYVVYWKVRGSPA